MHLSREMRRFEMEDLSSRRGDRDRYPIMKHQNWHYDETASDA
jgi:hypothetical protein